MDVRRKKVLTQQFISAVLFIAVIAMLGWLSTRFKLEADWTAGNRNTLTDASRKQLDSMPDPVAFRVFVYPRSEIRQSVEADVRRYQRVKDNVTLEFIDPSTHPQMVEEYNISRAGEVVVEYQGRRENLAATTEKAITTALQRLAYSGDRWVVFIEGHGEHGIDDDGQDGYSAFAQLLRDKGLKVRSLNLATTPSIPDNTSVLVLAGPRRKLLEGEVTIIDEYVQRGGNLLWMTDPDSPASLEPVARTLGIEWQQGYAILPESHALGLPPFIYIMTDYPENPVTRDFQDNAMLPLVRGLTYRTDAGWTAQPMLTTTEAAWLETGPLEGEVSFSAEQGDTQGPLTIGLTLTRSAKTGDAEDGEDSADGNTEAVPQRVGVVGDSEFLINGYIGQLGNSLLGLNLAQWLASRDAQLNIDVPVAPDRSLLIPGWGLMTIYAVFAFLLPVGLLGYGIARWIVRRRR